MQASIFIFVVFHGLHVWLAHVCVPFVLLNICCRDALHAGAVSMFMAYDFAHIMYMDISVFWNSMELSNNSNWPLALCWSQGHKRAMPCLLERHVSVLA